MEQCRPYLLNGEFIIYIDQKSLIPLNETRLNTPWQQKVFTKHLGIKYRIMYKQGDENRVADALSRRSHDANILALLVWSPHWCEAMMDGYLSDASAQSLLSKLDINHVIVHNFTFHDGLLRF